MPAPQIGGGAPGAAPQMGAVQGPQFAPPGGALGGLGQAMGGIQDLIQQVQLKRMQQMAERAQAGSQLLDIIRSQVAANPALLGDPQKAKQILSIYGQAGIPAPTTGTHEVMPNRS